MQAAAPTPCRLSLQEEGPMWEHRNERQASAVVDQKRERTTGISLECLEETCPERILRLPAAYHREVFGRVAAPVLPTPARALGVSQCGENAFFWSECFSPLV